MSVRAHCDLLFRCCRRHSPRCLRRKNGPDYRERAGSRRACRIPGSSSANLLTSRVLRSRGRCGQPGNCSSSLTVRASSCTAAERRNRKPHPTCRQATTVRCGVLGRTTFGLATRLASSFTSMEQLGQPWEPWMAAGESGVCGEAKGLFTFYQRSVPRSSRARCLHR